MFKNKKIDSESLLKELERIVDSNGDEPSNEIIDIKNVNPNLLELANKFNEVLELKNKKYNDIYLKFDLAIEAAEIGLWDFEFENGYPKDPNIYSGKTRELHGYTNEDNYPNEYATWDNSVHPEDKEMVGQEFLSHLMSKGKVPYQAEYRGRLKNGEYRWFKTKATTIFDEDGNPLRNVGAIFSSHEQRTELEKAMDLLKKFELVNTALRLTPPASEGVWGYEIGFDEEYSHDLYCWYSPQLVRLLGFRNSEEFPDLVGTLSSRIHPEEAERIQNEYHNLLNQGYGSLNLKYRLKMKNGDYHWFNLISDVNKDEIKQKYQITGVIKDITEERKKSEVEEEIVNHMNSFSASIYQLANATNLLTREAQQVSDEYNQTAEVANVVKESIDQTKGITDLIQQIAAQINLLGLNASIEAAHAGDEGNGFAVVAEEVRNLAIDSSNAVNDINEMMVQVNQSVTTILLTIDNLKTRVNSQAATTEEINATTENIKEMAEELLRVVKKL